MDQPKRNIPRRGSLGRLSPQLPLLWYHRVLEQQPFRARSIACQTDGLSISERLAVVDITARVMHNEIRPREPQKMFFDLPPV